MMTSLFLKYMFQTDKDQHFLSLVAYHSGIWYLGTYFGHFLLFIGHIASRKGKTIHRSSNNDVINLKSMIKRYTFSSILQALWPVALKLVFWDLSYC